MKLDASYFKIPIRGRPSPLTVRILEDSEYKVGDMMTL